jgi:multiple sugar transport system substrate-binding protein
MKRKLLLLLMMVLFLVNLTGCGPKEVVIDGTKLVVARWGGNDAETAAFNAMIEAFKEETGVDVEIRIFSDYNTELQAGLIGGTGPDVFYVDAYMAPFYIQQGVLKELDAVEFELDKFYDPLKNAFESEGKFYAVSKDYSTLALYYNKKFVNAADIPTTYETLYGTDYLTTLKASLPEGTAAMTYNLDLARQLYMAEASGASIIRNEIFSNLADAAVGTNLKLELDAAIAGKIVTPGDLGMGWNGDAFGNEKTAIMVEGNWVLGFLQQNFPDVDFGVLEVPTLGGKKGTMVFTVGYGINVKTKNEAASNAFVKFATGTVGMPIWTTGAGVLPSRSDVADATKVEENALLIPHIAGAAYATPWQKGTTMDTINNEYRNYVVAAVRGETTLSEALKKAQDEANSTIAAN